MDIPTLQSEVESISASYAERFGITRTDDWLMLKLGEELGELMQAYLARSGQARDKGRTPEQVGEDLASELADVLAHVLLLAERFDIDLTAAVERKWLRWKHDLENR